MNYKDHTHCRVCNSDKLIMYIDLGMLPLTNNLCETADEIAPTYPLQVMLCEECGLSQLSIVVDPELLFGHYVYRSSISQGYKDHCRKMAKDLRSEYGLTQGSFMIDIAGNDGALLNEFKQEIGLKVLNVDPAKNLVEINEKQGIRMYNTFWGKDAALHLNNTHWPKADLITATNVIAHVDDLHGFFEAITMILKPTGVFIIECPYIIPFIENNEFPTIYQEHVSIMSVNPLVILSSTFGLTVMKVEKQDIHCGSIRVHIGYGEQQQAVLDILEEEKRYIKLDVYQSFAKRSYDTIEYFRNNIFELKKNGYKIGGFAASAKFNTLLNCAGITNKQIDLIVDQTQDKIGKYAPGTQIPILSLDGLKTNIVDYLILGSWNFRTELIEKAKITGYVGYFILPIPKWEVV